MKNLILSIAALVTFAVLAPAAEVINVDKNGLALQGYDPIAYFTDGKPVKGSPQFTASYKGATYQFASAEQNSCSRNRPQNTNRNLADSVGMLRPSTNWRPSRPNISRSCTID